MVNLSELSLIPTTCETCLSVGFFRLHPILGILYISVYCAFVLNHLIVFSNFFYGFLSDHWLFRVLLFNFHTFVNSSSFLLVLLVYSMIFKGHMLHFYYFKFTETSFMAYHIIHLGEGSRCNLELCVVCCKDFPVDVYWCKFSTYWLLLFLLYPFLIYCGAVFDHYHWFICFCLVLLGYCITYLGLVCISLLPLFDYSTLF